MKPNDRYLAACHAVQSGVAAEMNHRPEPTSPKHLRTGLNIAMTDLGSLIALLEQKGIVSRAEVERAMAAGMEAEQARYEESLSKLLGAEVRLA